MDLHYRQELKVGFLVLAAVTLLILGLVWLSGRSIGGSAFEVEFATVQGVTIGDPVQISGVRVGRVAGVRLERVGRVFLTLEVDRRVLPKVDASVSVRSLDFLGAKYIEYDPGSSDTSLPAGQAVMGEDEADFAASAAGLADDASAFMQRTESFLSADMAQQLRRTLAAIERGVNVLNRAGDLALMEETATAVSTLQRAAARLDSTLANPAIGESISQMDEITESVREMAEGLALVTTSLGSVLQKIDTSEGTVGRLLNDPRLHDDLHDVLQSLKALLDDIREHPGRYGPRSIKLF